MKELQELSLIPGKSYVNYGLDFEEPLLEYVGIIAQEYKPITPENFECGYFVSTAITTFAYRYLQGKVDKSAFLKYLETKEVQETIVALGYDVHKFWYLLMFIHDYSNGFCLKGIRPNDAPKMQISKLIDGIIENISSKDDVTGDLIFMKPAQLVLKMPRKSITIDNPIAITWLAAILNDELGKIESGSKMSTSITQLKTINGHFENDPESNAIQIWYFAKMFLSFFDLRPPVSTTRKKGLNKKLLVSRLINCIGLSKHESFSIDEDFLKGYLNKYKNYKLDKINGFYL